MHLLNFEQFQQGEGTVTINKIYNSVRDCQKGNVKRIPTPIEILAAETNEFILQYLEDNL